MLPASLHATPATATASGPGTRHQDLDQDLGQDLSMTRRLKQGLSTGTATRNNNNNTNKNNNNRRRSNSIFIVGNFVTRNERSQRQMALTRGGVRCVREGVSVQSQGVLHLTKSCK